MSLEIVAPIIAKIARCNIEDITPSAELAKLGVTSLDTLTILFELEEAFDIEIPNEIIPTISTINDILINLEEHKEKV